MTILISALIGGAAAGLCAVLLWFAERHLGLDAKWKRVGQFLTLAVTVAVVRLAPVDQLSMRLHPNQPLLNKADTQLMTVPVFRVLRDDYPTEYIGIRNTAIQSAKSGGTTVETINVIRPRLLSIIARQTPKASDSTLKRQLQFVVKQATFLKDENPQYCHELLNTPQRLSFDPASIFPEEMANEELALMADILHETAKLPSSASEPINEQRFQELAGRAIAKLDSSTVASLQTIDFEPARAATYGQKAASCHFAVAMVTEINDLPSQEGAKLFRSLIMQVGSAS